MLRLALLAIVLSCSLAPVPAAGAAVRPNIVLVYVDDLGYGDIGPFGSTANRTPNLDRMAREGVKFTSFYAAPVCSVSRAQLMTGCYGQRVSITGVFPPASKFGINAEEHTAGELMRSAGYATMCIGKWHLGDQPQFLPTRHGFDAYFGIPYSNDMQRTSAATGEPVVPLLRDERVIELLDDDAQRNITQRYTDGALKFIRAHQRQPFFLYLPHTAVHVPIRPSSAFQGKSSNGAFGDWVEELDWSVGRILDTLGELGLDQQTLVFFTSDNGPWLTQGANGGVAGPLRGGKGSTWEGGVREPTLAWWPGKIAPASTCDAVAVNFDLLPTFVALAGGTPPADRKIDGRDLSGLLLGTSTQSPREAHFFYRGYKLEAVRVGHWKLAIHPQVENLYEKTEPVDASKEMPRLYNLTDDIGERTNVAAEHPDVVERLLALTATMAAELGDGKPGPEARPAGLEAEPKLLYPSSHSDKTKKPKGRPDAKKNA